jgi:AcrR family transcriptional regulator
VEPELPRVLAMLWGREEPVRRGPRPTLTLEAIGRAAIALADAQGLAAVSMKRVAGSLGVSTMALYRYVDTKDDLFTLMLEFASAAPPDLRGATSWRNGLEGWCRAYRELLLRHPWMLQVPLTGPPATPHQLGWMESALAAMDGMALSAQESTQVLLQLNVYVRGDVALGVSIGEADDESVSGTWAMRVRALTDQARFPTVHAMLASGEFDEDDDPAEQFEFGLQRMLDGVALLVDARAGGGLSDPAGSRSRTTAR